MTSSTPRLVNLDYAASTPLRPEALDALRAYDASDIAGANPNALHTLGRRAAQALERSRRLVAQSLGPSVRPAEVIFTGGGTEADALALFGIAEGARLRDSHRTRIITSAIEHDAILDNVPALRARGFTVELVAPNAQGIIDSAALEALLGPDVALVSIMFANNETGVLQPIRELADVTHAVGCYLHTDAIQGYLHAPLDVGELDVDALSLAGHKVGAVVASGALYLKRGTPYTPLIRGGGQEAGRRAGTQDVRSAGALAAVAQALAPHIDEEQMRLKALSDVAYDRLLAHPRIHATMGDPHAVPHLAGIISIYVDDAASEDLILQLDVQGYCVSAGSACSSGSAAASHVLTSMGLSQRAAGGSLRISFDDRVDPADLAGCIDALLDVVPEATR